MQIECYAVGDLLQREDFGQYLIPCQELTSSKKGAVVFEFQAEEGISMQALNCSICNKTAHFSAYAA